MSDLNSVVMSRKPDGSWQALHSPSGRFTFGESIAEAQEEMKRLLELGDHAQQETEESNFEGISAEIADFIKGPVSEMLAIHSGYARLASYEAGIVHIRMGGGCKGCPSSLFTLTHGVQKQLQEHFGEDVIQDVVPVPES